MPLSFSVADFGVIGWMTHPVALVFISVVLIGAGTFQVWRDLRNRRKRSKSIVPVTTTKLVTPGKSDSAVATATLKGSLISATAKMTAPRSSPPPTAVNTLTLAIADIRGEISSDVPIEPAGRDPACETSWRAVQSILSVLAVELQPPLVSVHLTLSEFGEASWSMNNRGFGAYRRVSMLGDSIAWLRCEVTRGGKLALRLRAHQPALAQLNADAVCDLARLETSDLQSAVSTALLPITRYATWQDHARAERRADARLSSAREQIIDEATSIANGALVEARAVFRRLPDATPTTAGIIVRHILGVLVEDRQIALMHIDEVNGGLDISVGVPDPGRLDLTRRQQLSKDRLASYELAEAMASCAWPALADALRPAVAFASPRSSSGYKL